MGTGSRTREEQAAADASRMKERVDAALRTRLIDRFGRPIAIGGMYEYHPSLPLVFRVKKVTDMSLTSSRVPPGSYTLELEATVMLPAMGGMPTAQLTLVELSGMDTATEEPLAPAGEDLRDAAQAPEAQAPEAPGTPDPDAPIRGKVASFPSPQHKD